MSTHWVHQPGARMLRDWGLLDAVRESGCPAISGMVFDVGPFALRGSPVPADGVAAAFAPRRTVLDTVLVNAAVAAGAEVREEFSVHEVVRNDDGAVTGIRGGSRSPPSAAGSSSVRTDCTRWSRGRSTRRPTTSGPRCPARTTSTGVGCRPTASSSTCVLGPYPDQDELTCLVLGWPHERFHEYRADIEGSMPGTIAEFAPELRERMAAARRETRFVGTADVPNFYRRPYGPG